MKLSDARSRSLFIAAIAILILPIFLANSFHYDVAIRIGLNGVVAIALNLLIGYAGQLSLGHAAFFGVGAYGSAILTSHFGWPPLAAMLASAGAVGALSFVIARPILKLKGYYLAMATLGLGIIISIVINNEAKYTGGPDGMAVEPFSLLGWTVQGEHAWYWLVGAVLLATLWLAENLVNSPAGRALRALHGSEVAAQTVGVDTARYKARIFVISAVFASLMGSLAAHFNGFITPNISGFYHSIELVTMVVLGGMASTYGALVGAAILTLLPQLLTEFDRFEAVVFGAILMLTMIFMPKGLVPTLAARFGRRRS